MNDVLPDSNKFQILYVDDEEKSCKYFQKVFARTFEVLTAQSVDVAIKILQQSGAKIAVLITDQRMPERTGVELLKHTRQYYPHIITMLTTAYTELEDAITAVNSGHIFRYITKPWDLQVLQLEVRQAMEFFLLRRERDLLLEDKLSVRSLEVQQQRIQSMILIGNSLPTLRFCNQAIAAYCYQTIARDDSRQKKYSLDFSALDYWQLPVVESKRNNLILQHLQQQLSGVTDTAMFADKISCHGLAEFIADAIKPSSLANQLELTNQNTQLTVNIALLQQALKLVLQELSVLEPQALNLTLQETVNGCRIDLLAQSVATPLVSLIAANAAVAGELLLQQTALFQAFLLIFHHAGAIELNLGDDVNVTITLPENANNNELPQLEPNWLEDLLVHING